MILDEQEIAGSRVLLRRVGGRTPGLELLVDGVPQSYIVPDNPRLLMYEYTYWLGKILDVLPLQYQSFLHLGGGGMTLPRSIAASRINSEQTIVELHRPLFEMIVRYAPLPERSNISMVFGDARESLEDGPVSGIYDIAVLDVYAGGVMPKHLTTVQFFLVLQEHLNSQGILLANFGVGLDLSYHRALASSLMHVFDQTHIVGHSNVLNGLAHGTIIAISHSSGVEEVVAAQMFDVFDSSMVVLSGEALRRWTENSPEIHDVMAQDSVMTVLDIAQAVRDRRRHVLGQERVGRNSQD